MVDAYCVRCKEKREIKDPIIGTTTRGVKKTTGLCSVCGTKICKIGS